MLEFQFGGLLYGGETDGNVRDAGKCVLFTSYCIAALPSCDKLFEQLIRRAVSRAAWTAGIKSPIKTTMIEITTSNSTMVNARGRRCLMAGLLFSRRETIPGDVVPVFLFRMAGRTPAKLPWI